jgi:hypothetical protein
MFINRPVKGTELLGEAIALLSKTKEATVLKTVISQKQAIADKGLPENEMLMRVNLALQGATHTKDIKTGIELKPEWLDVRPGIIVLLLAQKTTLKALGAIYH